MPERTTAAGAVTENSKPKTKYSYDERSKTRTPYEFLLPSKIPQSINI